jgi:hypothetical protein
VLATHQEHVTQFQVSDLKTDNIIFRTPVPTFGSSRCGLTDRLLISSCVYFLSGRDQIDQRETKKSNEVTNNAELARSKQLDGTKANTNPLYTQNVALRCLSAYPRFWLGICKRCDARFNECSKTSLS